LFTKCPSPEEEASPSAEYINQHQRLPTKSLAVAEEGKINKAIY